MKTLVACPRGRLFDSFFDEENIRLLESMGDVVWNPYARGMTAAETARLIDGCDAYISWWGAPRLDKYILERAADLRVILHLGADPSPYVCSEAWERKITVLSGERYYAMSAAEGTLAYILTALRDIPEYSQRLRFKRESRHAWDQGRGLFGKTVGLVNYSGVAECLVKLLKPFGVKIIAFDSREIATADKSRYAIEQVSLNEVFLHADIVSIHMPVQGTKKQMINSDQASLMKKGALLVDTSRAGIVDYKSVSHMLLSGRIAAIIDVCGNGLSSVEEVLLYQRNVTLMPHIAGPTADIRKIIVNDLLRECYDCICNGKSPHNSVVPR